MVIKPKLDTDFEDKKKHSGNPYIEVTMWQDAARCL